MRADCTILMQLIVGGEGGARFLRRCVDGALVVDRQRAQEVVFVDSQRASEDPAIGIPPLFGRQGFIALGAGNGHRVFLNRAAQRTVGILERRTSEVADAPAK